MNNKNKVKNNQVNNMNETNGMKNMGNKKRIRFLGDAAVYGLPFIRIEEGVFEGVVFMIDTGANDNVLAGKAYKQLEEFFSDEEGTSSLFGIDGKAVEAPHVSAALSFCGKEFKMMFLVREEDDAFVRLSTEVGFPVCGIIGTKFMAEHGWVIDFGKQEVCIPKVDVSSSDLAALRKE